MTMDDPFRNFSPEIQHLSALLKEYILERFPDAIITADRDNIGFGFGKGYHDLVFVISPHRNHVNLGFVRGVGLPDPDGLLEGFGKHHRHVKVRSVEELQKRELLELIDTGLQTARRRRGLDAE
jgi:hypothetical protein